MVLVIDGCVELDIPIFSENSSAKVPDISGEYLLDMNNQKTRYVFTHKAGNMYTVQVNGEDQTAIVEPLDTKDAFLLQTTEDNKKYQLYTMSVEEGGLRLYLPGNTEEAWNNNIWDELTGKYNLKASDGKLHRGAMTPEQYAEAVKSLFSGLFAANGQGKGMLLKKQ
jgi:hypothetical protein